MWIGEYTSYILWEAAKKVIFLVAGPLRGGGLNGCATKEKITFFNIRKKVPMATKPGGGGLKALVAGPLRKELFFAASLYTHKKTGDPVGRQLKKNR